MCELKRPLGDFEQISNHFSSWLSDDLFNYDLCELCVRDDWAAEKECTKKVLIGDFQSSFFCCLLQSSTCEIIRLSIWLKSVESVIVCEERNEVNQWTQLESELTLWCHRRPEREEKVHMTTRLDWAAAPLPTVCCTKANDSECKYFSNSKRKQSPLRLKIWRLWLWRRQSFPLQS